MCCISFFATSIVSIVFPRWHASTLVRNNNKFNKTGKSHSKPVLAMGLQKSHTLVLIRVFSIVDPNLAADPSQGTVEHGWFQACQKGRTVTSETCLIEGESNEKSHTFSISWSKLYWYIPSCFYLLLCSQKWCVTVRSPRLQDAKNLSEELNAADLERCASGILGKAAELVNSNKLHHSYWWHWDCQRGRRNIQQEQKPPNPDFLELHTSLRSHDHLAQWCTPTWARLTQKNQVSKTGLLVFPSNNLC